MTRRASELQYTGCKAESNRMRPTMAGLVTFMRIIPLPIDSRNRSANCSQCYELSSGYRGICQQNFYSVSVDVRKQQQICFGSRYLQCYYAYEMSSGHQHPAGLDTPIKNN